MMQDNGLIRSFIQPNVFEKFKTVGPELSEYDMEIDMFIMPIPHMVSFSTEHEVTTEDYDKIKAVVEHAYNITLDVSYEQMQTMSVYDMMLLADKQCSSQSEDVSKVDDEVTNDIVRDMDYIRRALEIATEQGLQTEMMFSAMMYFSGSEKCTVLEAINAALCDWDLPTI
jgi:hypothetical protein